MIFYFSGTGNTHWAAKTIAEAINERLLFIPEEMKEKCVYTLDDNEIVGFCFPVHGWMPPKIVRKFIEKLTITNVSDHFCFSLCTCGDDIGEAMSVFDKDLKKKSIVAMSQFTLIMPESYVCLPGFNIDKPEKEQMKITTAKKELQEFIRIINSRTKGIKRLVPGAMPMTKTYLLGSAFNRWMIKDKPFKVNKDKCVKCGICAKACPVCNIEYEAGKIPIWKHDGTCTNCMACYHHCPAHAIEYGGSTKKKGQYYFKE